MDADGQSDSFSILRGTMPWLAIFAVVHECHWTQAARDTTGRSNVGLCTASS